MYFDKESEREFHDGHETLLILHAAVTLLLYRGLGYHFAIGGMVLLPRQVEITGNLSEVLVLNLDEHHKHYIVRNGWERALKQCSRATVSFFCKDLKEPQFIAQIHLFEKRKKESFYRVDLAITRVRIPSLFFQEPGPDYRLDGSLKYVTN